jgi:hypothetical protein
MKEGDVFGLNDGSGPYRTEVRAGGGCEGCAGHGNVGLCLKLPPCFMDDLAFVALSEREAEEAIRNGTETVTFEGYGYDDDE